MAKNVDDLLTTTTTTTTMRAKRTTKATASTTTKKNKKNNPGSQVRRSSRFYTTIETSMENSTQDTDALDAENNPIEDAANEQGESSHLRAVSTSMPATVDEEVAEPVVTVNTGDVGEEGTTVPAAEETNLHVEAVVDGANAEQESVERFIQIDMLPWINQLSQMEKETTSKQLYEIPPEGQSTNTELLFNMPGLSENLLQKIRLAQSQFLFNNSFSSISAIKDELLELEHHTNCNFFFGELMCLLETSLYPNAHFERENELQQALDFMRYAVMSNAVKRKTINDSVAYGSSISLLLITLLQAQGDSDAGYCFENLIVNAKRFQKFNRNTQRLSALTKTFVNGLVFECHILNKTKVFNYTSEYFADLDYTSKSLGFGNTGAFESSKYARAFYEKVNLIIPGMNASSIMEITKMNIDAICINDLNFKVAQRIRSLLFDVEDLFEIVVSYKYFIVLFNNIATITINMKLIKNKLKKLIELDSGKVTNNFLLFLLTFNGPTNEATQAYKTLTDEAVPLAQRQVMINYYIDHF